MTYGKCSVHPAWYQCFLETNCIHMVMFSYFTHQCETVYLSKKQVSLAHTQHARTHARMHRHTHATHTLKQSGYLFLKTVIPSRLWLKYVHSGTMATAEPCSGALFSRNTHPSTTVRFPTRLPPPVVTSVIHMPATLV